MSDIPLSKTKEALRQIECDLRLLDNRRRFGAIDFYHPYPKQQEFFDDGFVRLERACMTGSGVRIVCGTHQRDV